jgi:hypothetical protein
MDMSDIPFRHHYLPLPSKFDLEIMLVFRQVKITLIGYWE